MAIYAIGDLQGCMTSLERLLAILPFDPGRDRLWLVGDLVNRGPRSLDVLRWAKALGDRVVAVLGNHDLHLLARAAGAAKHKKADTLDEVLAAPDRDGLIDWLRHRPLLHVEDRYLLVHAGLHPRWRVPDAARLARELEAGLRGDDWREWISDLRGHAPPWDEKLRGKPRVRAILQFLIRVRTVWDDDTANDDFDGELADAPKGTRPWFEVPDAAWRDHLPVFGHWAALGLSMGEHHLALDSGCVWGGKLTAVRLDDRAVFQVPAAE